MEKNKNGKIRMEKIKMEKIKNDNNKKEKSGKKIKDTAREENTPDSPSYASPKTRLGNAGQKKPTQYKLRQKGAARRCLGTGRVRGRGTCARPAPLAAVGPQPGCAGRGAGPAKRRGRLPRGGTAAGHPGWPRRAGGRAAAAGAPGTAAPRGLAGSGEGRQRRGWRREGWMATRLPFCLFLAGCLSPPPENRGSAEPPLGPAAPRGEAPGPGGLPSPGGLPGRRLPSPPRR